MRLSDVLQPEAVLSSGITSNSEGEASGGKRSSSLVFAVVDELRRHLPEGQQSSHHLEENLRSPQFRQALDSLSEALDSDSYNSVLANLGLHQAPGDNHPVQEDPVGAFLSSVQRAFPPAVSSSSTENMDVAVPTNQEANEEKDEDRME